MNIPEHKTDVGLSDRQLMKLLLETGCGRYLAEPPPTDARCRRRRRPPRARVVASDELETDAALPPGSLRIANLDTKSGPGFHWVLFFVAPLRNQRYRVLYFFDSLGECSLRYGNFSKFVNKYDILITNKGFPVQHQSLEYPSTTCGLHTIYVARKLCTGKYTLNDVMNTYLPLTTLHGINYNECLVINYVMTNFVKYSSYFNKITGCYDIK